jgi:phage I-like protein
MASAARKGNPTQRLTAMSMIPVGDTPPTEFRIFAAGKNQTRNGLYLFDAQAAREVMTAYAEHGADVMIDLEHLSVVDADRSVNYDPDARGWCKLELRNGELWAVDVTWTADGVTRLSEKRQRYISPCFEVDPETRRVLEIFNIAITAMPATDNLDPLVAASRRRQRLSYAEGVNMTQEEFTRLAEALELGSDATVEDVIATVSAMVKKLQDAANGTGGETEEPAVEEGTPAAVAATAPPVVAAASVRTVTRALARLTGKKDLGESIRDVEAWRTAYVEQEQERAKLAREKAALESGERRRLVGELVKLGAEIPATAWADDDATTPAEPWASLPMDQLRTRVAKLAKAKGGATTTKDPKPAAVAESKGGQAINVDGETVQLSASELAACTDAKTKPEDYARNKLLRSRAQSAAAQR